MSDLEMDRMDVSNKYRLVDKYAGRKSLTLGIISEILSISSDQEIAVVLSARAIISTREDRKA